MSVDLRYQASREWMEEEIFAGRPVKHRRQVFSVELDRLATEQASRVEAILDSAQVDEDGKTVTVLDSGIDPDKSFGPSEDNLVAMDAPIVQAIGRLPELRRPTEDIEQVIDAWESWTKHYCSKALSVIEKLNRERPKGKNSFGSDVSWTGMRVYFDPVLETSVTPASGPKAIQDARAAWAWTWAAKKRFSAESVEAAKEATAPPLKVFGLWIETLDPEEIAAHFLSSTKKMYAAAKAYDRARAAEEPSFETEMTRWASKHGTARLQLGIEDDYRMNARYLSERLAKEAPSFFAMPANAAGKNWARRTSSPSEQALRLRRRVEKAMQKAARLNSNTSPEVEIMTVVEPPPQIFRAEDQTDFPDKRAWPWWYDEEEEPYGFAAKAFEAVVVKNWLGRFHLIGGVPDEAGVGPAGVWAVPQLAQYHEDGAVEAQDPDASPPRAAKRKPPRPGEDDIPF